MAIRLFRDESILIFPMLQILLEPMKGHSKLLAELKELGVITLQTWLNFQN